jgi:hypothetical protein
MAGDGMSLAGCFALALRRAHPPGMTLACCSSQHLPKVALCAQSPARLPLVLILSLELSTFVLIASIGDGAKVELCVENRSHLPSMGFAAPNANSSVCLRKVECFTCGIYSLM